jgi:hypothetical protein
MTTSLSDTLARLGFTVEPSRYYGLHSLYDPEGALVGELDNHSCWQYLRDHGWIEDAA